MGEGERDRAGGNREGRDSMKGGEGERGGRWVEEEKRDREGGEEWGRERWVWKGKNGREGGDG